MDNKITKIWACVYPGSTLGDQELEIVQIVVHRWSGDSRQINLIFAQSENILNNWCSEVGKATYCALTNLWDNDNVISSAEARAQYVRMLLNNLHFIYKYPDACVSATISWISF